MSFAAYMAFINALEAKYPVDRWRVEGFNVWPVVRFGLWGALDREWGAKGAPASRLERVRARLSGLGAYLGAVIGDRAHNDRLDRKADAVFLTHTTCRTRLDGRFHDIYCDELIARLQQEDKRSLVLEFAPRDEYRTPRDGRSVLIQPQLDLINLDRRLKRHTSGQEAPSLEGYDALYQEVREAGYTAFTLSTANLLASAAELRAVADHFKAILARVGPENAFSVCYYTTYGWAFNLACRELGIRSIDIQHGVQGEYHPAYGQWTKVPSTGFEVLPSVFWCWGDEEAEALAEWCDRVAPWHRPVVGGNPWLDYWAHDRQVRPEEAAHFASHPTHVLVTLQPRADAEQELLLEVIRRSPRQWRWWIRIHPGMAAEREAIRAYFARVDHPGVEIDLATDLPLPLLLRHVHAHLTQCSSVVIDARQFGVRSLVTHENGLELYPQLVRSGWVTYAEEPAAIVSGLERLLELRTGEQKAAPRVPVTRLLGAEGLDKRSRG